jgi:fermentation-respiration switch protein FrsA (DUF1100 family)
VAAWAGLTRAEIVLEWLERSLLYFPTHDVAHPLSVFGSGAEEVWFGEHARLYGVFLPTEPSGPRRPEASGLTIVLFHGNGGNLSHRAPLLARMRGELGASLFIFDYQGYGRSSGRPSEAATAADARAALAYLRGRPDVDPARIVYYGESLGGAVAIDLALDEPPLALVAQSAFTSIADMTRLHYPVLRPLLPLARSRYDSLSAIGRLRAPLLVVHGEVDSIVPAEHGRRLFAAANEPKQLLIVPGADHNDLFVRAGAELFRTLRDFLSGVRAMPG